MRRLALASLLLLLAGCFPTAEGFDAGAPDIDAGLVDAGLPDAGPVDKAATCASTFGSALTSAFGRLDGTVVAVVGPQVTQCALPNSTHLVVQLAMNGEVYRVVVNVLSDGRNGTDTRLRYAEVPHALLGPPWAEGWHTGAAVALDYPTMLGVHSDAGFTPLAMDELVAQVTSRLELGARVSAFSSSSGGASSHLVHRNGGDADGALVVDPDGASPTWLLFYFDGTSF